MVNVVIVEAGRSPIGKRNGSLAHAHPADVLGPVMMEVLNRAGVDPSLVGQVVGGCINKLGVQGMNITRTAWLSHGGPYEIAASTVDSQCGSSQHAVGLAHGMIASGDEDIVLACGVENMSRLPIGSDWVPNAGLGEPLPKSYYDRQPFLTQFQGAERIAEKYGVTRQDSDGFGLLSQQRAARAVVEGRFEAQIVPLEVAVHDAQGQPTGERVTVSRDENPRETSLELLANLKPVANGIHTAGTSSQIADGAAAVLMMSADKAAELGVTPIAKVTGTALVGCDPVLMLEGPIPATERLLQRAGLTIDQIDVFEINEAFASIVLSWAKTVGADMDRVNPNGGAIALGHPLGATGCFLVTKAVHELQRGGGERALVTMCCGGGLGTGTLIERV